MKRRTINKIFRKICELNKGCIPFLLYTDDLDEAILKKELRKFSKKLNLELKNK